MKRALLALFVGALVVVSPLAGLAVADNSAINYDEGPDPYIYEQRLDKATHNMSSMGPLDYSDDQGEISTLPARLNDSVDEQFAVRYDRVDSDALRAFPRAAENSSALDASMWSTSGATVSDVSPNGVEGLQVSGAAGDSATLTLDEPLSDAPKRVLLAVVNVESLDAGATVDVRMTDGDGDYVEATVNGSLSDAEADDVIAAGTGSGYVYQTKANELQVEGSGDGSLDMVSEITIAVEGGSATTTFTGLDVERKSTIDLGETLRDTDGDGDDETVDLTEISTPGEVMLTDLDTIDSAFDDAVVHDLGIMGVEYHAADAEADDVSANFTAADGFANYPAMLDLHQRIAVPTAIDLTHSGLELRTEQRFVSDRYQTAQVAEGAGDTEFGNVSGYTDVSGTLSDKGSTHVLDNSVQPGVEYVVHMKILLLDSEVNALQETMSIGGPVSSSGGVFSSIWSWVAGAFSALTAWVYRAKIPGVGGS